jgi:hypothetical protein
MVMFVGYSDVKAFRDVFCKITGVSPVDYSNKYSGNGFMALQFKFAVAGSQFFIRLRKTELQTKN